MKKFDNLRAGVLARPDAAERIAQYCVEIVHDLTLAELHGALERIQKQIVVDLGTTHL